MIAGVVQSDEGRIRLKVKGPKGEREVEAIVDTGFTAYLTLPPPLIAALGLQWQRVESFTLADGSECILMCIWPRSSGTVKCAPSLLTKRTPIRSSECGFSAATH